MRTVHCPLRLRQRRPSISRAPRPFVFRLWIALAVLVCCAPVGATTRYISKTGSNGNSCANSTASTPSSAKLTFNGTTGAISCMTAGDVLLIHPGTWDELLETGSSISGLTQIPNGTSWGNATTLRAVTAGTVTILPTTAFPGGGGAVELDSAQYLIVDGLIVDGDHLNGGIGIAGHHIRISNTEVKYGRSQGIFADCTACEFLNVNVHHSGYTKAGGHDCHGGSQLADGFCHGYYLYDTGTSNLIEGGSTHDQNGHGVQAYAPATIIRNLLASNNDNGLKLLGGNQLVYNNVFVTNTIGIWSGATGQSIANNTFYGNTSTFGSSFGIYAASPGHVIKNNLLIGQNQSSPSQYIFVDSGGNNVVSSQSSSLVAGNQCDKAGALGCTVNTATQLINGAGGDYHLQSGVAAIDSGVNTASLGVITDKDGVARPQGSAYDVGAYEFGTVPTAVTGTYYMSLTGSDAVSCSAATNPLTPMRSFNTVLSCMGSGSILYLRAGTYTGAGDRLDSTTMTIVGGTSFSLPTTIAAFPGETVTLAPPLTGTTPLINLAASGNAFLVLDRLQLVGGGVVDRGVVISGSAHHIRVQNAVISGMKKYCFHVDGSTGNELLNSTCTTNTDPGGFAHVFLNNGASSTLIQANDLSDFGAGGIRAHSITAVANSSNSLLRNLVHDSQVGSATPGIVLGFGTNSLVANNRVWNTTGGIQIGPNHTAPKVYYNTVTHTTAGALTVDATVTSAQVINNIVWANATDIIDNSGTALRLTNLGPGTDPLFLDEPGHDYRLAATSPAINAGTSATTAPGLAAVTVDALGTLRPQGSANDIGAMEFVGTVPTAPGGPTNLRITGTTVGPIDSVALAWDAGPTDLYRGTYVVYRQPACTGTFVRMNVSLLRATTLSYTDNLVQPGLTYCWVVRAVDAAGVESVSSNTVQYVAAAYAPGTLGLSVALLGGPTVYTVRLTWTFTNGTPATVGFNAYRMDNCGVSGRTKLNGALLSTGTLTLDDTAVQNGKSHCWQVTGQDSTTAEVLFSGLVSLPIPNVPGVTGMHGAGAGQSGMMGGVRR